MARIHTQTLTHAHASNPLPQFVDIHIHKPVSITDRHVKPFSPHPSRTHTHPLLGNAYRKPHITSTTHKLTHIHTHVYTRVRHVCPHVSGYTWLHCSPLQESFLAALLTSASRGNPGRCLQFSRPRGSSHLAPLVAIFVAVLL